MCTALERLSLVSVLTGGSAAAYYAPNRYQSQDADFVIVIHGQGNVDLAMESLGYNRQGRMFVHPDSAFTVEFPPGPLSVGSDFIRQWERVIKNDLVLNVISRTDSVRDRLCGFYFWNERQSLDVALAVARSGSIDLDLIRDWSEREGALEKFREFERALKEHP